MKKIYTVLMVIGIAVCLAATAGAGLLQPKKNGNHVDVPDILVKAIPDYDSAKPVYAACHYNFWLAKAISADAIAKFKMQKVGDDWQALNMAGVRFHPVQLGKDGKPVWAQIEAIYPLDSEFVDMSTGSPCLLVK